MRYEGSIKRPRRGTLTLGQADGNVLAGGRAIYSAEDLNSGDADALAFGRDYIATPDLAERLQRGLPLNTPNKDPLYGDGAEGYTDYPRLVPVS